VRRESLNRTVAGKQASRVACGRASVRDCRTSPRGLLRHFHQKGRLKSGGPSCTWRAPGEIAPLPSMAGPPGHRAITLRSDRAMAERVSDAFVELPTAGSSISANASNEKGPSLRSLCHLARPERLFCTSLCFTPIGATESLRRIASMSRIVPDDSVELPTVGSSQVLPGRA
jgi:hypothetical protein